MARQSIGKCSENKESQIMIALDKPNLQTALSLAGRLPAKQCWMKVGLELFYMAGPKIIEKLKAHHFRVFLDLKMHDIPNTVRCGARSLTRLGVDMFNIHAAGGLAMMEEAMAGVRDVVKTGEIDQEPYVIAVTQLTSINQKIMNNEMGIQGTIEESVLRYSKLAQLAGLHGVVASPLEVPAIKQVCGSDFVTVTPGIRPKGSEIGDQARVLTPGEAAKLGTDYAVIGRPITAAADPLLAFTKIREEMLREQRNEEK